jgi:hypothetical protein
MKLKSTEVKKKARKAPSPVSAKKKLAAFEPKKRKPKKEPEAKSKASKSAIEKKLDKLPNKQKQKETNKSVKAIGRKSSKKVPAELSKIIHENYMEYLKTIHRPKWGNGNLDADSKGFDGYDSLRLAPYLSKTLAIKPHRLADIWNDSPGEKLREAVVKATTYNVWQWANFCSRLWSETLQLDPPIRRIVNIDMRDIIPFADYQGTLDRMFNVHLRDNKDAKNAFANLGNMRSKVRLLFTIQGNQQVSNKAIYRMFDMLGFPANTNSIWGITVDLSKNLSYASYPREAVILRPNDLRKSREAEAYLEEAIDAGYRVILPYELVKGSATSVKEMRQSSIYSKLSQSWKGLSPLITMPVDSKMVKVAKVSKLSDILLA